LYIEFSHPQAVSNLSNNAQILGYAKAVMSLTMMSEHGAAGKKSNVGVTRSLLIPSGHQQP
jgi:hypothetical protein